MINSVGKENRDGYATPQQVERKECQHSVIERGTYDTSPEKDLPGKRLPISKSIDREWRLG
jgi:hypothetical protein